MTPNPQSRGEHRPRPTTAASAGALFFLRLGTFGFGGPIASGGLHAEGLGGKEEVGLAGRLFRRAWPFSPAVSRGHWRRSSPNTSDGCTGGTFGCHAYGRRPLSFLRFLMVSCIGFALRALRTVGGGFRGLFYGIGAAVRRHHRPKRLEADPKEPWARTICCGSCSAYWRSRRSGDSRRLFGYLCCAGFVCHAR